MTGRYQQSPFTTSSMSRASREGTDEAVDLTPAVPGYLSAVQLAALRLPGLPETKRGINKLAQRDGWTFVDRPGKGGGRLFATADLPAAVQTALLQRRADIVQASGSKVGRPAGTDFFTRHPDIADVVEAILATRRLAAARVMELLAADGWVLPSMRTLQRQIARVESEKRVLLTSVRDPDAYRSRYRVALGRADGGITHFGQVWELDTTKADVLTVGGRKMVLGVIDRFSRRANFMVCDSESGQSVRRLLIETIRAWGVIPDEVRTDNGSGFINASIRSALAALDISHHVCPPGSPEKKGFVERVFGTFTRARAELLDGYTGHNVADAQALRARARKENGRPVITASMSPEALQDVLTNWLDGVYHLAEHSALRTSPMRKWQSSPAIARGAPDEAVLRFALSALVGRRKVGKRGIVWRGGRYWSAALAAWIDRDVMVRRDEDELGQLLVFAPDGRFIDVAVDHARAGLSEEMHTRVARDQQARHMAEARKALRAKQRKLDYGRVRDELLRRDAEAAGKLVHLPLASSAPASSPTIDSLAEVVAAAPIRPAPSGPAPVVHLPERATLRDPAARVAEVDALIARAEAGDAVEAEALRRARQYAATSEYRAQKILERSLGGARAGSAHRPR